jgi:hypothetical protein
MRKDTNIPLDKKIMIVAPAFLEWDLGTYLRKLCREKHLTCETFAYQQCKSVADAGEFLLDAARASRPDIILGLKLDKIRSSVIRKLKREGLFCALWYVDCVSDSIPNWIKPLLQEVDLFFTTAKGMVPLYQRATDVPVYWLYEGAYLPAFPLPAADFRPKELYRSEVAFVGSIYYRGSDGKFALTRQSFLKKIAARFDLKIWGPQGYRAAHKTWGGNYPAIEWPAFNEELVHVCRGADIVVGINTMNSVERYFSNRTYITLAAGGFHLTRYVPGLETMFENRKHLVWFHSDEECLGLIDYYLKRPDLRGKIAREGQRWTRRRYSMKRQLNKMLQIIGSHYAQT